MPESIGTKKIIQGEDIILLVDEKTTLHATSHTLKVDLEMKELRTKDTNGKEKAPGDISYRECPHVGRPVRHRPLQETGRRGHQIAAYGPCEDVHGQGLHHDLLALDACGRQRHIQLLSYRQRESDSCRQPATLILRIP